MTQSQQDKERATLIARAEDLYWHMSTAQKGIRTALETLWDNAESYFTLRASLANTQNAELIEALEQGIYCAKRKYSGAMAIDVFLEMAAKALSIPASKPREVMDYDENTIARGINGLITYYQEQDDMWFGDSPQHDRNADKRLEAN